MSNDTSLETTLETNTSSDAVKQEQNEKFFGNKNNSINKNTSESVGSNDFSSAYTSDYSWGSYFEGIGLIVVLLIAMYALLWFLRKKGNGSFIPLPSRFTRNDLRIEAQLPLGPKKTLYVVKYLNKRLLIGTGEDSISLITEDYIFENDENTENPKEFKEVVTHFTEKNT